jgi:hypothetical protein
VGLSIEPALRVVRARNILGSPGFDPVQPMKTKKVLIVSIIAAALQFTPATFAEDADAQDFGKRGRHARFLSELSADERAKLRAAHHAAMADPAVQAAKERQRASAREFRELKRARMLQADPSVQPILDKMPARGGRRGR